mmetsp:Transcript_17993/g.38136  ORF Transcript_17993/g.38136 Transcript_17993/m.38136 type:complete len:450 (-) Transcript_17993:635-1984(-)
MLANNRISGSIPERVTELPLLRLALQNNRLSGSIPEAIGKLNKVDTMRLYGNKLTGVIPDSFNDVIAAQECALMPGNSGLSCFDNPLFPDSRACPTEAARFACEPLKGVIRLQYCTAYSLISFSLARLLAYVASTMPPTVSKRDIVADNTRSNRGRRLEAPAAQGRRLQEGLPWEICYVFAVYVHGQASVEEVLEAVRSNDKFEVIDDGLLAPSQRSASLSVTSIDFSCLNFETMTDVREKGEWCYEGGRHTNPTACNNSYVTTFPSFNMDPGYFLQPHIYRHPNVREQRHRCVHNGLTGDAAKCNMEERQYQCPTTPSHNCTIADVNDIKKPGPDEKECSAIEGQELCNASYVRTDNTGNFDGIKSREYKKCVWDQGQGCVQGQAGLQCRDPDDGAKCIDVWYKFVAEGQSCGSLAVARALNSGESLLNAAGHVGATVPECSPCAIGA